MSTYTDELAYSLAKRVPAMEGGFAIGTSYGSIFIEAHQAAPIIAAVRVALEKEQAHAMRQQGAA